MIRRGRHESESESFRVAVERGAAGYSAAWALDLPGCYALIPPAGDVSERMSLAVLEYTAWSHQRSADRLVVEASQIEVVQGLDSGAHLERGETSAFFGFDAEPPKPREFPAWANPHDRAVDELRDFALALPASLQHHRLDEEGRTVFETLHHVTETERDLGLTLRHRTNPPALKPEDASLRDLLEAHTWLQQVVCDVPADLRTRRETSEGGRPEEWSVRKVMRHSIWHLRYHTWELRKAIAGLWVA
jgi:DinB superfamily